MLSGTPKSRITLLENNYVVSSTVKWASPTKQGTSFTSLEKQSTQTRRALNLETAGKPVTKSIDQLKKGRVGIGKGDN